MFSFCITRTEQEASPAYGVPRPASLSAELGRQLQVRNAAATPLFPQQVLTPRSTLLWRKDTRVTKIPLNPVSLVTGDVNRLLTKSFHGGDIFRFPFQA